jgi:hypothetical protein
MLSYLEKGNKGRSIRDTIIKLRPLCQSKRILALLLVGLLALYGDHTLFLWTTPLKKKVISGE